MSRRMRILLIVVAALIVGLPLLVVGTVLIVGNLDSGRRFIERETEQLTSGKVRLQGLAGRFPDRLRLSQLQLQDQKGLWLQAQNLEVRSSPLELLDKIARVDLLHADKLEILRPPDYGPSPPS